MEATHGDDGSAGSTGAGAPGEPLLAPAAILEGLPDAVVASTPDGRIVYVNALAEELFGYLRAELLGRPVQTLWPERVRDRYTRNMEAYFAAAHPLRFTIEAWGLRRDGTEFVGEMSWGVVETDAGVLLLAIGRDISARRAAQERIRALAELGERALAGADPAALAGDAVALLRTRLPIVGAEVRLSGGIALAADGPLEDPIDLPLGTGDELLVAPQRALSDEEMGIVRAVANTLSTALARLRDEERIRHEALHDPLTRLPNRTLLADRLEHALARSAREGGDTAVLFIDLDNFKDVNDTHGHAAGDAVLVEITRRLAAAVRPVDTLARFGGDEFVVVCEQIDETGALELARRLEEAIRAPISVGTVSHTSSASIGIALGRSDPETLLAHADAAVYRAKAASGGRVEIAPR